MGQITTILSGKGGVGKTTVAAWLGRTLANRGHKVLLVDGDFGLRDLDLVLGAQDDICFDGGDVLQGGVHSKSAIVALSDTLDFLPASASFRWEDIDIQTFKSYITSKQDEYDYILIDSPAGIGAGPEALASMSERILIVTEPTGVSIRNAQRVMGLLQRESYFEYTVLLNRVGSTLMEGHALEDICHRLGVDYVGGIIPELDLIQEHYSKGLLGCTEEDGLSAMIAPAAEFVERGSICYVDELNLIMDPVKVYMDSEVKKHGAAMKGASAPKEERASWLRSRKAMQQQSRWRRKW